MPPPPAPKRQSKWPSAPAPVAVEHDVPAAAAESAVSAAAPAAPAPAAPAAVRKRRASAAGRQHAAAESAGGKNDHDDDDDDNGEGADELELKARSKRRRHPSLPVAAPAAGAAVPGEAVIVRRKRGISAQQFYRDVGEAAGISSKVVKSAFRAAQDVVQREVLEGGACTVGVPFLAKLNVRIRGPRQESSKQFFGRTITVPARGPARVLRAFPARSLKLACLSA